MMIYLLVILLMGNGSYKELPGQYTTIAECEMIRLNVIREAVKETQVETLVSACMTSQDTIILKSYGGLKKADSKKEGA